MSLLRDLLGVSEPGFSEGLERLENASHQQGRDAKLIGDIHHKVSTATRRLGLDHGDTTGPELYHALIAKARALGAELYGAIGITSYADTWQATSLIKGLVLSHTRGNCWALRKNVAKRILRDLPPRKAMSFFNCRSIDSMLKRHDLTEIFYATKLLEDAKWHASLKAAYQKLTPSDFEPRKLEVVVIMPERWAELNISPVNRMHALRELGQVAVMPPEKISPDSVLWMVTRLIYKVNDINIFSCYVKSRQLKDRFGDALIDGIQGSPILARAMVGHDVQWQTFQRHTGSLKDHPAVLEPHLLPEDMRWHDSTAILALIEPAADFWIGLDYVGKVYDNKPLSFNLADVADASYLDIPYEQRPSRYLKLALHDEILLRYLHHQPLYEQLLDRL